jgi:hypothetical protein
MDENPYRAPMEESIPPSKSSRLSRAVLALMLTFVAFCFLVAMIALAGAVATILHPDALRSGTRFDG